MYFFVIVCLLMMLSCAARGTKRGVQDNIFYSSSNPAINIKISPDFVYTGSEIQNQCVHDRSKNENPIVYAFRPPNVVNQEPSVRVFASNESHQFYNSELKRRIKIDISTLTTPYHFWRPDRIFDRVQNKLASGVVSINGKKYQYCVFMDTSSSGTCWLVKGIGRMATVKGVSKININYEENLEGKYTCSDWEKAYLLNNGQKVFLNEFNERSEKDIQILKTVEIMGGTQ
jgi:hypothetical protein